MSEFTNTSGGGAAVEELTVDELAAINGAADPDAGNVFATMDDVPAALTLETPTGDVDGVNDEFTFTAVPIFIEKNGQILHLTEDYTLVGAVATLLVVPAADAKIRGLI